MAQVSGDAPQVGARIDHRLRRAPVQRHLRTRVDGHAAESPPLVVVGHATLPPWAWDPDATDGFLGASDLVAALNLERPDWEVRLAEEVERTATGPDGQHAAVRDAVLHASRLAA